MEKVNSDDLLLKILSFLPTKVAVATSILSKRWRFLWMWLPNLDYDDTKIQQSRRQKRFRRFIKRNLPLHKAPIIENLRLKFSSTSFQPEDIKSWVGIAVSRSVCHLSITYSSAEDPAILPFILYSCKSLVTLKLEGMILVDVPRLICLSSLKTLHLRRLTYAEDKSLQLILSDCHVLEVLIIERKAYDNLSEFKIIVPSLERLSLMINARCSSHGYVIDTPSLRYLKVKDYSDSQICLIKNMPKLEKADIDVVDSIFDKFLCSITSVKSLSLRIRVSILEAAYGDGIVFNQLEDMKLCINATNWSKLLARLLQDSPKLRALELFRDEHLGVVMDPLLDCWDEGNCVPECLLSSLETFKWRGYEETLEGRRIVEYILTNACCLKTATIMARSWFDRKMRVEMMMDLLLFFPLAPNSCEIVLD